MHKSEAIDKLAAALSKFQSAVSPIPKSGKNPHFGNTFSTLEDIDSATREGLAQNGLSVSQLVSRVETIPILVTILMHSSGQWISGEQILNPTKNDPQAMGSAISYAKRYGKLAILGLSSDEDDDGNKASGRTTTQPAARPAEAAAPVTLKAAPKQPVTVPISDPGEFMITFGKYQNKKVKELTDDELNNYAVILQKMAERDGKSLSKNAQAFMAAAEAYLMIKNSGGADEIPLPEIPF